MIVAIKNAGSAIAGYKNIRPSIFVEIERRHAERVVAIGAIDVRFCGDVFKSSVAAIVIENVLRAGKSARAAHHGNPFPDAGRPLSRRGRGREIEIHIVGDNQIEAAIAIVVDEGAARAPGLARSGDSGLLSDFSEDPMIVVVKAVLPVVGDVEIFPSVIVVIPDADALAPTSRRQPCFGSDIGKGAVVIIMVEAIRRSLSRGKSFQPCAVDQEDIGPAVIVVIEDGDPDCR